MNSFLKGFLYFLLFAVLLFAAVFGARFVQNYLTQARATPQPENVEVREITQTTAKITWTTEKDAQSIILYGETPGNLPLMAFEDKPKKDHEVNLSLLNPRTTYYFKIKVGEQEFDDQGLPWQFTTLSTVATPTPPSFNPSLFPQKFGTSDPLYDLNHDGVVNFTDYSLYLQSQ